MNKEIPTTDTNKTSAFTEADLAAARELVAEANGDPDKLLDLKELLADAIGGPEAKVGGEVVRVATFGEPDDKTPTIIKVDDAPDHWRTPRG